MSFVELRNKLKKKAFHCVGGMECQGGFVDVVLVSDVEALLVDLEKSCKETEKTHVIIPLEKLEDVFEGVEVYYETPEIKKFIESLKDLLLGDEK